MSDMSAVDARDAAARLARSERLSRRQFQLLPLTGPGAAFTEVQGRTPGAATAPEDLAELISSIATVGVLQPILVEQFPDGKRRLVTGERRLRAAKWVATSQPDEPRYQTIPAVTCPGPLPEEDRRVWQLVENLSREDLRPGELAAALMFERCAVLAAKLLAEGVPVPADRLDDPVSRFRALDRLRLTHGQSRVGAPWPEVLRRLGIQMTERRARQLAHALASLPADLSADMDAHKVALHTRIRYLRLDQGNRAAARDLWEAVKQRGRPELLTSAVRASQHDPGLTAGAAVDAAEAVHAAANEARADQRPASTAAEPAHDTADVDDRDGPQAVELAAAAVAALQSLLAAVAGGARLSDYERGSLRLYATQLMDTLDARKEMIA